MTQDMISNAHESICVSTENGLQIAAVNHSLSNTEWLNQPCEVFQLTVLGKTYKSTDFTITKTEKIVDHSQNYLIYELQLEDQTIFYSRVSLFTDNDNAIKLLVQLGVDWKGQAPQEIYLHIPFFKNFGKAENKWYLSSNPVSRPDGVSAIEMHDAMNLPICNIASNSKTGFSIEARNAVLNSHDWNQLRNYDLLHMTSLDQLMENKILLRQQNTALADIFELAFYALSNGWPEAFGCWKERVRSQADLSMYDRKDLEWYRKSLYQHLAFAYSKEIFDYDKQCFDPQKLIRDSEEYGGCDLIILWFVYPRLGVDRRTQWDFANDMPGGMAGLRDFVQQCHECGVKVFLPYNPWDDQKSVSSMDTADLICQLIRETEIDGIWLDTMDRMPDDFRKRVDEIRPGVVFCLEQFPATLHMLELITGHWDQFFGEIVMPQANILRYVFPENNAPITSRWQTGEGKDRFLKRAIFNGTGIAVWQDIFGSWMPFSAEQKKLMKKWKGILLGHFDTFFGKDAIPLYPVMKDGLYANRFINDDRNEMIYTLYNATHETICDALLEADIDGVATELLTSKPVQLAEGILQASIDPEEVLVICVRYVA